MKPDGPSTAVEEAGRSAPGLPRSSRKPSDTASLPSFLAEVVRRIVAVAQPEKIILFGSAARGTARPGSDLDLLVIKAGAARRWLSGEIYRSLIGVGCAVDVVVATPQDLARYERSPALVFAVALREGKAVYAG